MQSRSREYVRPKDIAEAQKHFSRADAKVVLAAVGARPPVDPFVEADVLLDLSSLDLSYIKEENGAIRVGGQTSMQEVATSTLLQKQASGVLCEAALLSAGLGLRLLGTVAETLRTPDSPPELLLALMALEAEVVTATGKRMALKGPQTLPPDELLLEVIFARHDAPHCGGALARVARTPKDSAMVAAVAVVFAEEGMCEGARLAVGGQSQPCARAVSAEAHLHNQTFNMDRVEKVAGEAPRSIQFRDDYRASASYRAEMAKVLSRRALSDAWKKVSA